MNGHNGHVCGETDKPYHETTVSLKLRVELEVCSECGLELSKVRILP